MNNKGFVIMVVILVIMSLSALIGAFSLMIVYKNQEAFYYINSTKAYYLAQSALEYSQYACVQGPVTLPGVQNPVMVERDSPAPASFYDLNRDGNVDIADLALLWVNNKAVKGSYAYVPQFDMNDDGKIGVTDMSKLNSKRNPAVNCQTPDSFVYTLTATAKVEGMEQKMVMQMENNMMTRRLLYKDPVIKWE